MQQCSPITCFTGCESSRLPVMAGLDLGEPACFRHSVPVSCILVASLTSPTPFPTAASGSGMCSAVLPHSVYWMLRERGPIRWPSSLSNACFGRSSHVPALHLSAAPCVRQEASHQLLAPALPIVLAACCLNV
uniref:Uncharacterized protein n=1 Tax=Crocodylus porosus TaxID=8502 RepID=A0A7M4EY40_CROPO